jgi:hypothetical protein
MRSIRDQVNPIMNVIERRVHHHLSGFINSPIIYSVAKLKKKSEIERAQFQKHEKIIE